MSNQTYDHDHDHELESRRFIFRGEVLALDFVNTVKNVRGKPHDLLTVPEDLALWWEEARARHPELDPLIGDIPAFDAVLLDAAKTLRTALRGIFVSIVDRTARDDAHLQTLNAGLRMGSPMIQWGNSKTPERAYWSDVPGSGLLLPVALSALHLLTEHDLSRLHRCHNHRCILLFYDTTKSATRQWCSTECFERERSSRRYAEKKRASDE